MLYRVEPKPAFALPDSFADLSVTADGTASVGSAAATSFVRNLPWLPIEATRERKSAERS